MAKKTEITGYHVRAYPVTSLIGIPYNASPSDQRDNCNHIASMIKKHITKNDDNCSGAEVVEEKEETCDFCGNQWTESDTDYNGGCCDEDIEAYEASLEAKRATA